MAIRPSPGTCFNNYSIWCKTPKGNYCKIAFIDKFTLVIAALAIPILIGGILWQAGVLERWCGESYGYGSPLKNAIACYVGAAAILGIAILFSIGRAQASRFACR